MPSPTDVLDVVFHKVHVELNVRSSSRSDKAVLDDDLLPRDRRISRFQGLSRDRPDVCRRPEETEGFVAFLAQIARGRIGRTLSLSRGQVARRCIGRAPEGTPIGQDRR